MFLNEICGVVRSKLNLAKTARESARSHKRLYREVTHRFCEKSDAQIHKFAARYIPRIDMKEILIFLFSARVFHGKYKEIFNNINNNV